MTQIVTRFAPSPTGYLHIGGARTALFNWLYARHHGGRFLLRIEDTDRARSTQAAVDAILNGLAWLGLAWDGEAVSQFARVERHRQVVEQMLADGRAYRCYATPAELEEMRAAQKAAGLPQRYDGRWRDRDPAAAPAGIPPVIRIKAARAGETVVEDGVQGRVAVRNDQLDDLILLRSDGTPTYMLAVVVDDHDFGVTDVIRGDDHFTNTFRQMQIYQAAGWDAPRFAHIPLIHGADGAKLSKRHGAVGLEAYRDMGMLPEALRNYLLRLGWAHGDAEILSTEEAIRLFDIAGIGRSPSRFDLKKLESVNAHWLRQADDARLLADSAERLAARFGRPVDAAALGRIAALLAELKPRVKTLVELADQAAFLVAVEALSEEAAKQVAAAAPALREALLALVEGTQPFAAGALEAATRALAERMGVKLGQIAQPLRAALAGQTVSPPIFAAAAVLGREEVKARLQRAFAAAPPATA